MFALPILRKASNNNRTWSHNFYTTQFVFFPVRYWLRFLSTWKILHSDPFEQAFLSL